MDQKTLSGYFLFVLIALTALLAVQIFMPFLAPLSLAAAFAVVLQPLYVRMLNLAPGKPNLAASLVLVICLVCIVIPLSLVLYLVGLEVTKLYISMVDGSFVADASALVKKALFSLPPDIFGQSFSENFAVNVGEYARNILAWLSGHIGDAFSGIIASLIDVFIFFVALFFFLRDGESIKQSIITLSPLNDHDDRMIFERLGLAVNSVIRGNLLIALLRGIIAAVGFFIFGIPNPVLWGIVGGLAGLIPGIGITIVFVPAILYAFFTTGIIQTIGLALWGLLVVGLIDNALAPRLVGRGMRIHPLFIVLSIFGGIPFFGPVGIFLGPLTLSLLFALLSVYTSPSKLDAQI